MPKTVVLTGKAVVSFRKVIENPSEFELEQLLESDDYRGAVIEEDDLTDLEWIHDDVEIEVTP